MNRKRSILQNQKGFSLMEILIVITLIAIAGTFVVNQLLARLDEGKVNAAKIQINSFKGLLEDYRRYCNQYPTTEQSLDSLLAKPSTAPDCPNYPTSGFIQGGKIPLDPWDRPYSYESDGKTYTIISLGSDGAAGGEGAAKDIKSNEL